LKKYSSITITVILAVLACGAVKGFTPVEGTGRNLLVGPLLCLPPDSFEVNPLLPEPEIYPLSPYTDHLENIQIEWEPEINGEITHYWVISSNSRDFGELETCSLWEADVSSCSIYLSEEDTVYCRVYSVDNLGRISGGSETVSTIADTTAPEITSFLINGFSGNFCWVSAPAVQISFEGSDNTNSSGCELMQVIERDSTFNAGVRIYPLNSFSGTISYRLSTGYERKVVYARLVDRAGNESAFSTMEIMYEKGAHCYPNPFNPDSGEMTNFVYRLSGPQSVKINVYDKFGNLVFRKSANGVRGWNETAWDGRSGRGDIVASGGYICVIEGEREYKCKVAVLR